MFIGEYGFPAVRFSAGKTGRNVAPVILAALQWGCPLVLYWEFYNNEVDPQGRQRGFWMIDNHGVKQPIYETHRRYYQQARAFVAEEIRRTGHPPKDEEFRRKAVELLSTCSGTLRIPRNIPSADNLPHPRLSLGGEGRDEPGRIVPDTAAIGPAVVAAGEDGPQVQRHLAVARQQGNGELGEGSSNFQG